MALGVARAKCLSRYSWIDQEIAIVIMNALEYLRDLGKRQVQVLEPRALDA